MTTADKSSESADAAVASVKIGGYLFIDRTADNTTALLL